MGYGEGWAEAEAHRLDPTNGWHSDFRLGGKGRRRLDVMLLEGVVEQRERTSRCLEIRRKDGEWWSFLGSSSLCVA